MAKLVLDVQVKNAKTAEKSMEELGKAAVRAEKAVQNLSGASPYTQLAENADKVKKSLQRVSTEAGLLVKSLKEAEASGFDKLAVRTKAFLLLEKQVNDEIAEQVRLTALLAQNKTGNTRLQQLGKEVTKQKEKTKALRDQAKALGLIEKEAKKADTASKKRQASQSAYWLREIKYLKQVHEAYKMNAKIDAKREADRKKNSLLGKAAGFSKAGVAGAVAGITAAGILSLQTAITRLTHSIVGVGVAGVRSFFEINTQMEQTKILLSTALGGEAAGERMFGKILEMAEQIPYSIDAISDSFVKLETAGLQDATRWVSALSDAIAAFGGTSEDLKYATIAIQQMAGKGVVSMEELRRQLGERVPTAINNFADELGMTYGQLVDEISAGSLVFNEHVQNALLRGLERHAGSAQKLMQSMKGAIVKAQNAWIKLMIDIGGSNDLFKTMAEVLESVATNLSKFAKSAEGTELIDKLTKKIRIFIELFKNPKVISTAFRIIAKSATIAFNVILKLIESILKYSNLMSDSKENSTSGVALLLSKITGKEMGGKFGKTKEDISEVLAGFKDIQKEIDELNKLGVEIPVTIDRKGEGKQTAAQMIKKLGEEIANIGEVGVDQKIFELKLKLSTDEDANKMILAQVMKLKEAARKAGDGSLPGYQAQVGLLERARDLLGQMNTTGKKVSKDQVEAARKNWEYQQRITRGGKSAYGTAAKAYNEAYQTFKKLDAAQKSGEPLVDEKAAAKQKKLLEDLYRMELESTQNLKTRKEELDKELTAYKLLDEAQKAHEANMSESDTKLDKIGQTITAVYKGMKQGIDGVMESMKFQLALAKEINSEMKDYSGTPGLGGRARGGNVSGGTSYKVNEQGPEVFTPSTAGYIIPNHIAEARNSETVNINLSLGGSDPVSLSGSPDEVSRFRRILEDEARYAA